MTDLTGKTIAAVTERSMAARDTFGEWHDYTLTTLHFTDGTKHAFALDNTDTYSPEREQLECKHCDANVVESDHRPGEYVHPFDTFADEDHEPEPKEREPYAGPDPEPRKNLPRTSDGFVDTSAAYGHGYAVEVTYTTDYDGRPLDDGEEARTLHGPFGSQAEAKAWVEDAPDADDVEDYAVVTLNGVRPAPKPVDVAELLRIARCGLADAEQADNESGDWRAAAESAVANIGVVVDRLAFMAATEGAA